MSTTHLIAIDGDRASEIVNDMRFAEALYQMIQHSGGTEATREAMRVAYGVTYVTESMDGLYGAIENAWRKYL